jgi:uncharacterized membrane protein
MDLYEGLKTVHVLAAIAWVGGAILSQVHAAWVINRAQPEEFSSFVDFQAMLSKRYFAPLSGVVLLAGIWMVIDRWSFSDTWVIIGLVLFAITALTGSLYLGPQTDKIKASLATGGDTELQQKIERIVLATRIDLAVLIAVVADMVIKPGL